MEKKPNIQPSSNTTIPLSDLLSTIVDIADDAIIAIDHARMVILFNNGARRVFGYDNPAEIVGKPLDILLATTPKEIQSQVINWFASSDQPGRTVGDKYEISGRRKDGSTFPAEANITRLVYQGQETLIFFFRDITEQQKTEEILRQNVTQYDRLIGNVRDIIYAGVTNEGETESSLTFVSSQVEKTLGFLPESLVEAPVLGLDNVHPDDVQAMAQETRNSLADGKPRRRIYRVRHNQTDEYRWLEDDFIPQVGKDGKVDGYFGVTRDITNRKHAKDELDRVLSSEQQAHRTTEILRQANLAISRELDTDAILQALLDYLHQLVPYDTGNVMLIEEDKYLAVRALRGYDKFTDIAYPTKIVFSIENLASFAPIFSTLKSLIIPDTREFEGWQVVNGAEHVISWMGIPLIVGGNIIGIYSVDKELPGFFTEEHRELAEAMSSQAAVALQNAQLLEESRQHTARAEALVRIASRMNAGLELDAVLKTVCIEAAKALDISIANVTLYDERLNLFRFAVSHGLSPSVERGLQPVSPATMDKFNLTEDNILVIPDIQQFADFPNYSVYKEINLRTLVSVTMLYRDELVGRLNIGAIDDIRKFSKAELELLLALADQAAQAIANAQLYTERLQAQERIETQLLRLQTQRAIDRSIANSLDVRLTLKVLVEAATSHLGVDAASVLLFKPASNTLDFSAGIGFRTKKMKNASLRLGQGLAGRAALERRMIITPNIAEVDDEFIREALMVGENFVSYYGVPMIARGQINGVLEVFHRSPLEPNNEWVDFLETLAGQGAVAVDSAQSFEALQRSNLHLALAYDDTIRGWSQAMDLRDKETEGHTQRVTDLTVKLAEIYGIRDEEIVHIRRGSFLHDMGKLGIPDSILLKPGKLTDDEWRIMKMHPQFAFDMLSSIDFLRPALDIPYCHHEKWDGSGYPRGLIGEQIPLAARIFAVVDVWDALSSDRPYRKAWSREKVLEYIKAGSNKHFDPKIVDLFLRMIN